jgi:hypothetical protein
MDTDSIGLIVCVVEVVTVLGAVVATLGAIVSVSAKGQRARQQH